MLIKSLPEGERPVEKAVRYGIASLSNAELLALIIHTGTRGSSSIRLAEEVLSRCGNGLNTMGGADYDDLIRIPGIGPAKACTVLAAVELGKRISTSVPFDRIALTSPEEVAALFMEELRYEKKEYFKSVLVNSKGEIISVDNVSVGELSSTVVHPREVFSRAVRKSAAAVIFVHNHPSGDPAPSEEDIATTDRLVECGKLLGIRVLDHIIIGNGVHSSLKKLRFM